MKPSKVWGLAGMVLLCVLVASAASVTSFVFFRLFSSFNACNIPVIDNDIGAKYGRERVSLEIAAADYSLDVGGVTIEVLHATDSSGTSCAWKTSELPDKYKNPGLCIEIDSRAAKDVLTATGELRYKGITYCLDAKWEAAPDKSGKDSTDYWRLVRCELQKKEGADD
jgi:hypothetical protein